MTNYDHSHALMFRVYFDGDAEPWVFDWMEGWLDGWEEWEDPAHSPNQIATLHEPLENEHAPYYSASWWFDWAHDRAAIYDALIKDGGSEGTLPDACEWVRVGYHDCTHHSGSGPCSWDEVREYGSVPPYIESMEP